MQGPHHVAQKSITTTFPASSALVIVFVFPGPSRTVRVNSGAGLPSKRMVLRSLPVGQRVDLGKALGSLVHEGMVLRKFGGDRASLPAELLDREFLPFR